MKQYIKKDACYGVKVYVSELKNLKSHERLLLGQEMRKMDGEILEAKVEETRVHALKHETLALVSIYSVHFWQWQRDREEFEHSQKYFNRQSDMRSPDKAGIKPLEKLSSAFVCESTHLRWDITCSQSECETSCLDIMMKHQKSLRNGWAGAKTGSMTSSPFQIKGTVLIWKVTCLLTLMSFKPLWLWYFYCGTQNEMF